MIFCRRHRCGVSCFLLPEAAETGGAVLRGSALSLEITAMGSRVPA